jgi:hypothetical protein
MPHTRLHVVVAQQSPSLKRKLTALGNIRTSCKNQIAGGPATPIASLWFSAGFSLARGTKKISISA